MPLIKFESMLKTNEVYFFDATEFVAIIQHYIDSGKHALAHKALKLGLEQHPSSIELKLLLVELLTFDDKIDKAILLLQEIESIEPYNDEVFIQKAIILSKTNKHKEAIAVLQESLDFIEDPSDVWSLLGMEYMYLDDYENARLNFAKCIEVDLEDYSSLYNVLYCFEMNESYQEAIEFLNAYIDTNPYSEVAWHQLGRQYYMLGMYKQALSAFDYAVIVDESFIGGYLEKAKTLEELGRYQEAIENYLITLQLDDPTAFAYVRIGECFDKLGQTETAIIYFNKAVVEDPLLDKGWLYLTNMYQKQNDVNGALENIHKALELDDTNTLYWRKFAELNVEIGDFNKAVKAFNTSIQLGDIDIEVYVALADVLLTLNNFNDALNLLIKAKKTFKEFAEIEYRLCGLFMLTNRQEYAITHLKNGLAIDFEYHQIIEELFPAVYSKPSIKLVIDRYVKAID